MNKKEINQSINISMKYFLETYYNVTNQALLDDLIKMSHKDIKIILEMYGIKLKRTCFQDLTREKIASGEVILVTDGFGNLAPYKNPLLVYEEDYFELIEEKYVKKIKRRDINDKY